jgi:OmpA-OmpF porin, OOP family
MMKFNSQLFFLFLILPILTSAQKLSFGISTGFALYQGDVTERFPVQNLLDNKPTIGGFVKFQVNEKLSLRASYLKGEISGDEKIYHKIPWREVRGFSFKSPISEWAAMAEWDILTKHFTHNSHSKGQSFSVYLTGGIGYVKTDPKVDFNEPNPMFEDVNIDKLAQYNRNHIVAPIGIGVKYKFAPNHSVSVEAANRTTFTDYLDGISKTAQPKNGDWYLIGIVSYSISLGFERQRSYKRTRKTGVSCPKFR